jgi:hypothetical protein
MADQIGIGGFVQPSPDYLLDGDNNTITDGDGNPIQTGIV